MAALVQVDALKIAIGNDSRKSLKLLEERLDVMEEKVHLELKDIKQLFTSLR